jgi:hypothetical protein
MAAGRVPVEPENERAQTAADQGYGTILASLAYLLWKRGIITPGDYQVMSGATNCNLFEIAAKIIEIADDPRT